MTLTHFVAKASMKYNICDNGDEHNSFIHYVLLFLETTIIISISGTPNTLTI